MDLKHYELVLMAGTSAASQGQAEQTLNTIAQQGGRVIHTVFVPTAGILFVTERPAKEGGGSL